MQSSQVQLKGIQASISTEVELINRWRMRVLISGLWVQVPGQKIAKLQRFGIDDPFSSTILWFQCFTNLNLFKKNIFIRSRDKPLAITFHCGSSHIAAGGVVDAWNSCVCRLWPVADSSCITATVLITQGWKTTTDQAFLVIGVPPPFKWIVMITCRMHGIKMEQVSSPQQHHPIPRL